MAVRGPRSLVHGISDFLTAVCATAPCTARASGSCETGEADPHCTPVSKPAALPAHPSNPRTSARSSTPPESSR